MRHAVPVLNCLILDEDEPHLEADVCEKCGARFLMRRIACARCGGREFGRTRLANTGKVGSFTIVYRSPATVPTPYTSALVDLDDGFTVKAQIVRCPADPDHVKLGMPVRLSVFDAGVDVDGVVAVAFGYEAVDDSHPSDMSK